MTDGYYPQTTVLTDRSVTLVDVLIRSGQYIPDPDPVPPDPQTNTLVIFPGLVEICSRCGEPGFETRETLNSLRQCAQGGGFLQTAILPYTPIDRLEIADYFSSYDSFLLWGSLTDGAKLHPYNDLQHRVVGFAHPKPLTNLLLLRHALEYLAPTGKPLLLIPQQSELATGVMTEGYYSLKFGLPGIPPCAETIALSSIIELVRLTRCPVHVMGISNKSSIALLEQAKNDNLPLTASVLWTHLLWNSSHLHSYSPHLRLNPPLPDPPDQTELIKALKIGTIDAIAINHTPYTYEEKMIPFEVAPPGTIGLQFAFSLLWSNLVSSKQLTPLELLQALRTKPAQILGIDPPSKMFGFWPESPWTLNSNTSLSLAQNTILWQQQIPGKIIPLTQPPPV